MSSKIRLGLCCINTELRKRKIYNSRTLIRKNYTLDKVQKLALDNIRDISKLCQWNYEHEIYVFRLSSDIFPHYTDEVTGGYSMDFALESLKEAGEAAKRYHQRINMHPGQYNQVGAKDEEVFSHTIADLKMHADILDAMGVDEDGIICVHGGGTYGDKRKTIERWIGNFSRLPENVRRRLCIENCERQYSVLDCLEISEACNIPVIFDSHHFECYNSLSREQIKIHEVLPRILDSWRDRRPLFHIAEQRPGARLGAHSDFIETIPDYLMEIPEKFGRGLDLEVEAKMKEQAILRLYGRYPELVESS